MNSPLPTTSIEAKRLERLAPRPITLADLGVSLEMLISLSSKHLLTADTLTIRDLSRRLAISGPIVDSILQAMRKLSLIEIRAKASTDGELRFGLTERGRHHAHEALDRNGYVGPAPVPLAHYAQVVKQQTVHSCRVTRDAMRAAFSDVVLEEEKLDQLGPALNSGRAIFLYGSSGAGKTFIARRLVEALRGLVLVPHAICVNDTVLQIFDPLSHRRADEETAPMPMLLEQGHDPRYVPCRRPFVAVGGELTADMLDIQLDAATRINKAPIQLRANNGMLLIDDLGRQRISCEALFNRWILPMEEQRDYLTTGHGQHFAVPFDLVLVFSTNLEPRDIADPAFLRRIGYKVPFGPITRDQYCRIWEQVCDERGITPEFGLVSWLIDELHEKRQVPLLPCHPRDLVRMALDLAGYHGEGATISRTSLQWAWNNYFLRTSAQTQTSEEI